MSNLKLNSKPIKSMEQKELSKLVGIAYEYLYNLDILSKPVSIKIISEDYIDLISVISIDQILDIKCGDLFRPFLTSTIVSTFKSSKNIFIHNDIIHIRTEIGDIFNTDELSKEPQLLRIIIDTFMERVGLIHKITDEKLQDLVDEEVDDDDRNTARFDIGDVLPTMKSHWSIEELDKYMELPMNEVFNVQGKD